MLWGARCTEKVDIYSFGIVSGACTCCLVDDCCSQAGSAAREPGEGGCGAGSGLPLHAVCSVLAFALLALHSLHAPILPPCYLQVLWEICSRQAPERGRLRDVR
jgi:hypothetical protein